MSTSYETVEIIDEFEVESLEDCRVIILLKLVRERTTYAPTLSSGTRTIPSKFPVYYEDKNGDAYEQTGADPDQFTNDDTRERFQRI